MQVKIIAEKNNTGKECFYLCGSILEISQDSEILLSKTYLVKKIKKIRNLSQEYSLNHPEIEDFCRSFPEFFWECKIDEIREDDIVYKLFGEFPNSLEQLYLKVSAFLGYCYIKEKERNFENFTKFLRDRIKELNKKLIPKDILLGKNAILLDNGTVVFNESKSKIKFLIEDIEEIEGYSYKNISKQFFLFKNTVEISYMNGILAEFKGGETLFIPQSCKNEVILKIRKPNLIMKLGLSLKKPLYKNKNGNNYFYIIKWEVFEKFFLK